MNKLFFIRKLAYYNFLIIIFKFYLIILFLYQRIIFYSHQKLLIFDDSSKLVRFFIFKNEIYFLNNTNIIINDIESTEISQKSHPPFENSKFFTGNP